MNSYILFDRQQTASQAYYWVMDTWDTHIWKVTLTGNMKNSNPGNIVIKTCKRSIKDAGYKDCENSRSLQKIKK